MGRGAEESAREVKRIANFLKYNLAKSTTLRGKSINK